MIRKIPSAMALVVMFASAAVLADGAKPVEGKPGGWGGGLGKAISFEELKERCIHPEQFDVQRAPQNMKLQCTETRLGWIAAAPGEMNLPARQMIVSGVFADKFFVNAEQAEMPVFAKAGSCLRFREIQETVTVERPMACNDLLSFKGSLAEFCGSVVAGAKSTNPKLVDSQETGRMIDTCGGSAIQINPKGPK
jgi:hypothetical protein